MSGFKDTMNSGIRIHDGDPNCDAAHSALLAGLKKIGTPFLAASTSSITVSQKGNLGEYITLHIALSGSFGAMEKFAQNALQPLSGISGSGLDLTYVYFDPQSQSNDLLYIQEIKTTSATNLNYLNNLEDDYEKLFSRNVNFTLQTRIQCLANSFEIERNNSAYADRVQKLGEKTPQLCSQIRLLPTGVHNKGVGNPAQKMTAIQSSIVAFGWHPTSVNPWAIALSDLEDRLLRLAKGQS